MITISVNEIWLRNLLRKIPSQITGSSTRTCSGGSQHLTTRTPVGRVLVTTLSCSMFFYGSEQEEDKIPYLLVTHTPNVWKTFTRRFPPENAFKICNNFFLNVKKINFFKMGGSEVFTAGAPTRKGVGGPVKKPVKKTLK